MIGRSRACGRPTEASCGVAARRANLGATLVRTTGRTIVFSALTVAAAMISLTVFPQRFLVSMGIGGAIVALVAAARNLRVGRIISVRTIAERRALGKGVRAIAILRLLPNYPTRDTEAYA